MMTKEHISEADKDLILAHLHAAIDRRDTDEGPTNFLAWVYATDPTWAWHEPERARRLKNHPEYGVLFRAALQVAGLSGPIDSVQARRTVKHLDRFMLK